VVEWSGPPFQDMADRYCSVRAAAEEKALHYDGIDACIIAIFICCCSSTSRWKCQRDADIFAAFESVALAAARFSHANRAMPTLQRFRQALRRHVFPRAVPFARKDSDIERCHLTIFVATGPSSPCSEQIRFVLMARLFLQASCTTGSVEFSSEE